jgi:exopolysaccharide production protein ExoQ
MASDSVFKIRWFLVIVLSIWLSSGIAMASLRWDTSLDALMQQFDYDYKDNKLEEQRAALNKWLIIGYLSLAMLGVAGVVRDGGKSITRLDVSLVLPLLFWGWCCTSVVWSLEPSLSIRRVGHLIMSAMGGLGITLFLKRQEMAWSICLTMFYLVVAGYVAELWHKTFFPWASSYRFSGIGHPNETSLQCSVAILSGRLLLQFYKESKVESLWSERGMVILLITFFLISMIMTKSRTTLASTIVALLLLQVAVSQSAGAWMLTSGLAAGASIVGLMAFSSPMIIKSVVGVATVGRTAEVGSLTGRLPLWQEIIKDWEQQPTLGFGYGAYWTTKRVETFAQMFHWEPPNGHSIYVDSLVELGPVGTTLLLLALLSTFLIGLRFYRESRDTAALYSVSIACFAMIHGLAESSFFKGCVGPLLLATSLFFLWQNRLNDRDRRFAATRLKEAKSSWNH